MMKRGVQIALAALLVAMSIGILATAQPELDIPGYVRSDMHLISQESKPMWNPRWTGPIQAATILAWFHDHGYPDFLHDFNGDGVVDELDTIELADILGRNLMRSDAMPGTTDAHLVYGLAQYVADQYPGQFILKIYDTSFPSEFMAQGYGTFAPDAIPGIVMTLEGEPTVEAYEYEMETAEGVIVGLEENELLNTYFGGRSFLYEQTPEGYTAIDMTWAEEDRWEPGQQGKVLETDARNAPTLEVLFRGRFTPAEFMLALSPLEEPEVGGDPYDCPPDALAYHVIDNPIGDLGTIQIEECVTREGDFDTYTYTVTNIDFLHNGCGLCFYAVAHPAGLPFVAHSEPAPWQFMNFPGGWVWRLPNGSCGLLPGQSAVFSVTVPGPTIDQWVPGLIATCPPATPPGEMPRPPVVIPVKTTGPGLDIPDDEEDCPDLIVRSLDESCVFDPADALWRIRVWGEVENIGGMPTAAPAGVLLTSDTFPSGDFTWIGPPINPGDVVPFELSYTLPAGIPAPCPENYTLQVDPDNDIVECLEDNNTDTGEVCCDTPDDGETCPDLTIEIIDITCEYTVREYLAEVTVEVSNIGTAVANSIFVQVSSSAGTGGSVIVTLAPSASTTKTYSFGISLNDPPDCPLVFEAEVDYTHTIDECDEDNNEDTGSVYCPNCK